MAICSSTPGALAGEIGAPAPAAAAMAPAIKAALITGSFDKPYAFGLSMALVGKNIHLDVIGSDEVESPEMYATPRLNFLNLRGNKVETDLASRVSRTLRYYARLVRYAAAPEPRIFHILWNDKFEYFDRTILALFYRILGKKVVRTAHNVNAGKRDGNDSLLNRLTLRVQYQLAHHIFVHTEKMRHELLQDFGVRDAAVTVIPFGINNAVPDTALTPREAKRRLGIEDGEKTILFFGAIRPYKGLEYLAEAFQQLAAAHPGYRLIIAGNPLKGNEEYLGKVQRTIASQIQAGQVIQKIQYIPDEDTELYFKAADVLALPYTHVFQSGVLFLAHSFGLPVIATDVGSLRDDIVEGRNGFLCKPCDSADLARALQQYFASDLFETLDRRRPDIRAQAEKQHSWEIVSDMTRSVYEELVARPS